MTNQYENSRHIFSCLKKVQQWVEAHEYRGYEPFDGLSTPLRALTFGSLLGERLLMQAVRQSPFNLRPLLGISPKDSTKGRGYMAWGYLTLHRTTGEREYLEKAVKCLEWLDKHRAPKYAKHSWSNHFDFASRGGTYTSDDPIIVWTALIGQAYLEAFEQTGESRWLRIAESVCDWIMSLPREKTDRGSCISYLAHVQSSIHNSNMLGAAMLARGARHTGNRSYLDVARNAMEYSCGLQMPDGSWWYGEEEKYHWIDNFHTGYNLESLKCYTENSGDSSFRGHLLKGLEFYRKNLFEQDGCPKYYHNRRYPVDIQCAAQAIQTLAEFSTIDSGCLEQAVQVARWTIENMQTDSGYFIYRIYPFIKAKTPMLHWGQCTTFMGLACLCHQLKNSVGGQGQVTSSLSAA